MVIFVTLLFYYLIPGVHGQMQITESAFYQTLHLVRYDKLL